MLAGFAVVALAPATSVLAHHGWGEYDSSRLLTLTGSVKEFDYANPHGTLRLATPDKTWFVILAPPSRMESRGLPRDAVKIGDQITVEGHASRSKVDELRAERVHVAGKVVELR
ncbi:MAG: hypothetical protein KIT25_12160 [Enhydrobacter sp.]|nr:MAG: hypothetical protein KIT25_12160 [Enhydrobacter sp.]